MADSVMVKNGRFIALLFIIVFIKEIIWFSLIPPFQIGDEPSHYDYVVYQAKQKIPGRPIDLSFIETAGFDLKARKGFGYISPEVNYLNNALRSEFVHEYRKRRYPQWVIFPFIINAPFARPQAEELLALEKRDVISTVAMYPTLYYAVSSFFYRFGALIDKNNIILPFYCVRFFSIICFIFSLYICLKTMRRLGVPRILVISVLIFIGFQPELSMASVSVNPDNLAMVFVSLIIFYAVDIMKTQNISSIAAILLGIFSGLLWLTKVHLFLSVFSGAAMAIFLYSILKKRYVFIKGIAISSAAAFLSGVWFSLWSFFTYGTPFGYPKKIDEVFLSAAPSFDRFLIWTKYVSTVGVKSFWGNWGWLEFNFPHETILSLSILSVISCLSVTVYVLRNTVSHGLKNFFLSKLKYLPLVLPPVIFTVFLGYFNSYLIGTVVCQGRQWFPFILPVALILFYGFWMITQNKKWRIFIVSVFVAYIMILDIYATIIIYKRYYFFPKNKPDVIDVMARS